MIRFFHISLKGLQLMIGACIWFVGQLRLVKFLISMRLLTRSGLIPPNRQLGVVSRHDKVSKFAAMTGNFYYGIAAPKESGVSLCGPYLAVGYRDQSGTMHSRSNRTIYMQDRSFYNACEIGSIGRYSIIVVGERTDYAGSVEAFWGHVKEALATYSKLRIVVRSNSDTDDPQSVIRLLGGIGAVRVYEYSA